LITFLLALVLYRMLFIWQGGSCRYFSEFIVIIGIFHQVSWGIWAYFKNKGAKQVVITYRTRVCSTGGFAAGEVAGFLPNAPPKMSDTIMVILSKTVKTMSKSSDNTGNAVPGGVSLLERITPLARKINCLDIERISDVCINDIPKLVGVRFASLYILDETNNILLLQKYNHPFLINKIVSINQNPPSSMVLAVRSEMLMQVQDIDTYKRPIIKKSQRAFAENYKTSNCIIAPLVCQDKVVGVLNLADKIEGDTFSCDDIALVELLSQLVGASIGNIKLFEKIQHQATTDGLTSLANHKTFYETLERELWRTRRYGGRISLIMIDVDDLKKINDTCGHRLGDRVICEISKKIKACIRQTDTAARYGGDEFAVILPNTALADAVVVAERMVSLVAESSIIWKKERMALSISVGVGEYDGETSPEDITSCSDQALYMAKQAGKNTVKIFEPPPDHE
jgi:diguanylate cyclase (GGDEF)-like protein